MKPPPPTLWSLVGTRAPAETAAVACRVCTTAGAPAVVLMSRERGKDWETQARLCLPCIARAVEGATGWRITRAWAQWLASSQIAQTHRTNKGDQNGS
jgi:hypothetical protein